MRADSTTGIITSSWIAITGAEEDHSGMGYDYIPGRKVRNALRPWTGGGRLSVDRSILIQYIASIGGASGKGYGIDGFHAREINFINFWLASSGGGQETEARP